ncbi:type VI secretion system Vgr family protein [Pseudomonas syringae]|uniref:type VI secretion system Vgr family protein n=1 Tax=Pseudomonas syringae TaxID=317 RepID=UPI00067C489B|nr:type VI secretion system tip protein TssI/VgrG [Pseudomonas syringae]
MSEDQQLSVTLTIDDNEIDMAVVSVRGREGINETYCFSVDLISSEPDLQSARLERRCAWLAFGANRGVHGKLSNVTCLYAGANLSLYRIELRPHLRDLQQGKKRRILHQLSVPQILKLLLSENGMDSTSYRFDQMVGIYPPRPICVQHDESDLHLLQRLCEEEGIHFRFEHCPTNHCLVFADDPASFAQRLLPMRFQSSDPNVIALRSISYLAEHWRIHPASTYPGQYRHGRAAATQAWMDMGESEAPNERFEASTTSQLPSEESAHERQLSARQLERQRCERRVVLGRSDDYVIGAGLIIQVLDHPVSALNDHWLLVEVTHAAKQPQVLEGQDTEDVVAIVEAIEATAGMVAVAPQQSCFDTEPFSQGYRNHFRVLPWEMAFRPTLKHCKQRVTDYQQATLLSGETVINDADKQARLPIRFDWQAELDAQKIAHRSLACFASHLIDDLRTGRRLLVGYFEGDADCPAIFDVADNGSDVMPTQHSPLWPAHKTKDLSLRTDKATFTLTAEGITVTREDTRLLLQEPPLPQAPPRDEPASSGRFDTDLRLTRQHTPEGEPYSNRLWYIVRMLQPGLHYVAWLEPEHFLLEGKTDEHGNLGLNPRQLRQLAAEYRATPENICLVHPGYCITLKNWFQQNWSDSLFQDFLDQDQPEEWSEH